MLDAAGAPRRNIESILNDIRKSGEPSEVRIVAEALDTFKSSPHSIESKHLTEFLERSSSALEELGFLGTALRLRREVQFPIIQGENKFLEVSILAGKISRTLFSLGKLEEALSFL